MKKSILFLLCAFMMPFVAQGAGRATQNKDFYGDLNFRPNYDKDYMYIGIRGSLSFLNWENKYTDEQGIKYPSDNFKFKSMIGMNVFVGYQGHEKYRGDIEFGYVGKYSEDEAEYPDNYDTEKYDFDLETFYMTLNGYYNFSNGLYAGLGAGMAFVNTSINANWLANIEETNISPMGALMFGWSYKMDEKVTFDLRYRFAVYDGGDLKVNIPGGTQYIKTDIGLIKDNSLSAGIRYSF